MEVQIETPVIPEKNFVAKSHYKFSEVLEKFELKPYILRFWESEFDQISPIASESGQKIYTPKDLYFISRVKDLLLEQKLPIQKAKLMIDKEARGKTFAEEKEKTVKTVDEVEEVLGQSQNIKSVEVSRFRKSLYSKSRAQMELNHIKDTLQKAQKRIEEIKEGLTC